MEADYFYLFIKLSLKHLVMVMNRDRIL